MILAGDIGGTKTLLALFDGDARCLAKKQYQSADFVSFDDLLTDFLAEFGSFKLKKVCLGIAGPIVDGDCDATNLPWRVRKKAIGDMLQVTDVHFLNDLEAAAWGVLSLPAKEFVELNPEAKTRKGNIAVIAAGTGLGEAIICRNANGYLVMSTEGGHADFAPNDELEIELLKFLSVKYSGHVSYERLVSGMGIRNIYQFLKEKGYFSPLEKTEIMMRDRDAAEIISKMAQSKEDPICIQTMRLFCRIYAAEAGNLALKTLAYGGVVLAGGIAAKNLILLQSDFMRRFQDKGRYSQLMRELPVKVCTNPEAALLGAARFAIGEKG